jgi:hypothetical protein
MVHATTGLPLREHSDRTAAAVASAKWNGSWVGHAAAHDGRCPSARPGRADALANSADSGSAGRSSATGRSQPRRPRPTARRGESTPDVAAVCVVRAESGRRGPRGSTARAFMPTASFGVAPAAAVVTSIGADHALGTAGTRSKLQAVGERGKTFGETTFSAGLQLAPEIVLNKARLTSLCSKLHCGKFSCCRAPLHGVDTIGPEACFVPPVRASFARRVIER